MAWKPSQASIEDKSLVAIKRTAVNTSGCLGSLYNGYRNQIRGKHGVVLEGRFSLFKGKAQCEIKTINTNQNPNLLELIDLDVDLRLSILLNMIPKCGLASLIDYSHPINTYTRFLHYTFQHEEQQMSNDRKKAQQEVRPSMSKTDATHIITGVTKGIDLVVVLQLPCDSHITARIDEVLDKVRVEWKSRNDAFTLPNDDIDSLEKISKTTVYSNVTELMEMTSLVQICQFIPKLKQNAHMYCPVTYTLRPIEWLYPDAHKTWPSYYPLAKSDRDKLEQYLIEISNRLKEIKFLLGCNDNIILPEYDKGSMDEKKNEWQELQNMYECEIKRLEALLFDIRNGKKNPSEINQALNCDDQMRLKEKIEKLMQQIHSSKVNVQSTSSSQQQQQQQKSTEYYTKIQHELNGRKNEQTVEHQLVTTNPQDQVSSSDEKLTDNNQATLSTAQTNNEARNEQNSFPLLPGIQNSVEDINLLLVGESGVGTSTFINAVVNYFTFQTLSEAESKQPIALMSVSFLITTGDNFIEQVVKLDVPDTSNNEDFQHPGQSVTQQCRSYVFTLNHNNGRKLRIIDTPGFGDTRGLDQDDKNMQHTLEYINNYTHLNAICFLLKPNSSRLHIFFRTCLTQLLDLLGPNARQNIIFCFTNARSTCYTSGNTVPLLRTLLNSLSTKDIIFTKDNTFCFDNKSFRYLVARQNGISFGNEEMYDYERSWSKSVTELHRLLTYICQNLTMYRMHDDWKSIKHAQLEISHMVRPMLETMRNILRNIILLHIDPKKRWIALSPKPMNGLTIICLSCKHEPYHLTDMWFLPDCEHDIQKDKRHKCSSASTQHIPLSYVLDYNIVTDRTSKTESELLDQLSLLNDASFVFGSFLLRTTTVPKDDLFLTCLKRMVDDEKYICTRKTRNNPNRQLSEQLEQLIIKYRSRLNEVEQNKKATELSAIYNLIKIIQDIPEISAQLTAAKRGQAYMMAHYEYEVPNNSNDASLPAQIPL